jgi:hypothetical protein
MRYEIRPLGHWTDPETRDRKGSGVFKAGWQSTLDLLGCEAKQLGAALVVVQVDVREADLRRDGMLKATAKAGHPGAVVSLDSKFSPLRYAADRYEPRWSGDPPGWQANVRAVALALEALRAVDRYGVTKRGEQYQGWTAIASASPGRGPFAGRADAEEWMRKCAAEHRIGRVDDIGWAGLYRLLAKQMHPDVEGGNADLWERLDAAAALLGIRKGGSRGD